MKIITERLVLRDLEPANAINMFELSQDPEVTKHMDYIVFDNFKAAEDWTAEKIKYNNEIPRKSYNFAILKSDDNEFVGWIGIGSASDKTKGDLDFGYAILKSHWGHGYATESLKAIIELSWKESQANKIFGECRVENLGSKKVMENAGLIFEKKFTEDDHESLRYSILRPV